MSTPTFKRFRKDTRYPHKRSSGMRETGMLSLARLLGIKRADSLVRCEVCKQVLPRSTPVHVCRIGTR